MVISMSFCDCTNSFLMSTYGHCYDMTNPIYRLVQCHDTSLNHSSILLCPSAVPPSPIYVVRVKDLSSLVSFVTPKG
jgi:hypothetical protein